MARVVQQQKSNPPYLLIFFVFLFLVSTVLAVLMYLDGDKAKKADDQKGKALAALVNQSTLDTPAVQAMMANYQKDQQTVVAQQQQQIAELTQCLMGSSGDFAAAKAAAEQVFLALGSRPGLANQVTTQLGDIARLREDANRLNNTLAGMKAELGQKNKELADLAAAAKTAQEKYDASVAELDAKLAAAQKDREKAVADLTAGTQKEVAALNKTIAEQNALIPRLNKTIEDQKIKIAGYENSLRNPGGEGDTLALRSTGVVLKANGTDGIYVNLGANKHVRPGMGFSVYPASGIPSDANNSKAKLVVTAVNDLTSQCRVALLRDKNNPILPDDLVYNVFLERGTTLKFVVVGLYDIYNTSAPSLKGQDDVKLLIQSYGGVVENEITNDTDYIVRGAEPGAPRAPAPGETPAAPLPEIVKAREAYLAADKSPASRVLNVNRFLNMVGFDPTVTTGTK